MYKININNHIDKLPHNNTKKNNNYKYSLLK